MKNTILLLTIFATSTLFHTTTAEKSPRPNPDQNDSGWSVDWSDESLDKISKKSLGRAESVKRLVNAVNRSRATGSYSFDFGSDRPLMAQQLGTYTVTTNNYYNESAEGGDLNILKSGQDVNIVTYGLEDTLLLYNSGRVIASLPTDTIATVKVGQSTWGSPKYISLTRYQDAFGVLDGSRVHSIPSLVLSAKRHCWESTDGSWRSKRDTKLANWLRLKSEVVFELPPGSTEQRLPVVIPDEAFAADLYANEVGHGRETVQWHGLSDENPDEYTRYIKKAGSIGKAEKLAKGRVFWNMLAQTLHNQDKKSLQPGEELTPWPQIGDQWRYYKQAAEMDPFELKMYLTGIPSNISAIEAGRKKMVQAMVEYIENHPEATLKEYLFSTESRLNGENPMDYETQLLQPNDAPDWTFAMQYTKCWEIASKTALEHINAEDPFEGYYSGQPMIQMPYYFPVPTLLQLAPKSRRCCSFPSQQATLDSEAFVEEPEDLDLLEAHAHHLDRLEEQDWSSLKIQMEQLRCSGGNSDRNKQSEVKTPRPILVAPTIQES